MNRGILLIVIGLVVLVAALAPGMPKLPMFALAIAPVALGIVSLVRGSSA